MVRARRRHLPARHFELDEGSNLLGILRLSAYFGVTMALSPPQLLLLLLRLRVRNLLPRFYHRLTCRIIGLDVEVRGTMSRKAPTLFVSNHTSYFDIPVLGSLVEGSFVAKTEVGSWPVFGWLSKMQRTVFVDRRRHTTHRQRDELQRRLDAGDNLILFPEGTSNDGNAVLPFRSALLSVAEREARGETLTVQPVSVTYTKLNSLPMGYRNRAYLAWYGDMTLGRHLWQFARLGPARVVVEFHDPISIADFRSRKELTRHCYAQISGGVANALHGKAE
ncbi:lysophospholipid acyltransferase family protein [Dongia sp.]|uniref:lysophospholipid acyltransferase family protein n=1 Tax=Dongia sp. TaxID=1977262 RepID=UPI0035AFF23C